MANVSLIHSSKDHDWETPSSLVRALAYVIGIDQFDLDPCADINNKKATKYYDLDKDGLKQPWFGHVFCNPPYKLTKEFLAKRLEGGWKSITYLIPNRTDTKYWHQHAFDASHWFVFEGRIGFLRPIGEITIKKCTKCNYKVVTTLVDILPPAKHIYRCSECDNTFEGTGPAFGSIALHYKIENPFTGSPVLVSVKVADLMRAGDE